MSIVSTLLFMIVIWMGIDSLVHSNRSEIAGSLPGALLMGWTWFLIRKKQLTLARTLLVLGALFVGAGILGALQYVVISRMESFTNSDRYDFLAGSIIPGLLAVAAWRFLKGPRVSPTGDQTAVRGGSQSSPPEGG